MAILFRPSIPLDRTHWLPVLERAMYGRDFRVAPGHGNPGNIEYLITWKLEPGDATNWPSLKAVLSQSAGVNQYIGHPDMPQNAALIRMLDPSLRQSMAEYVASFVFRFHREHDRVARENPKTAWGDEIPKRACERTVGFMGLGVLSNACIDMLRSAGFRLQGWSRTAKTIQGVRCFAGASTLPAFLAGTDILVNLLPLTPDTENILDQTTLSALPKGAFLINAARGKHIVDEDLLALLNTGHLAGAALDVFRKEPLPAEHPFYTHPKIIVTPHIAAVTVPETAVPVLIESIDLLEKGLSPPGLVDRARGY